jgi:hypothetical protein
MAETDTPLPPAPNNVPVTGQPAQSPETCAQCQARRCENGKRGWTEYGCWCGGNVAPAETDALRGRIPDNPAQWDQWVLENNLPQPEDEVDRCCMKHDLALGQLRKHSPGAGFASPSWRVARINADLTACFARQRMNSNNSVTARRFAARGTIVFAGLTAWNVPTHLPGAEASTSSGSGFGSVGANSASTGGASGSW